MKNGVRQGLNEVAGSLGDLGTFLPLAIGLIAVNGVSPTALFLSAGLLYIGAGLYYGIPIPVQPLKATAAIAISLSVPAEAIRAAALWIGLLLLSVSLFRPDAWLAKIFTRPVVRGVQLGLAVLLVRGGLRALLEIPAHPVASSGLPPQVAGIAIGAAVVAIVLFSRGNRRYPATLVMIPFGVLSGLILTSAWLPGSIETGWIRPVAGIPLGADPWTVFIVLLLPQIPLTFANSIAATTDVAARYYGERARKVTPRHLAISLGLGNLLAGILGGMPMCHGSGGVTAHHAFGARTGRANLFIGLLFLLLALVFGKSVADLCRLLPAPVLGAMLLYVGFQHARLVRDVLHVPREAVVAASVGLVTLFTGNLAAGFLFGFGLDRMNGRLFRVAAGEAREEARPS